MEEIFVTITGMRHHYGSSKLKPGMILKLSKEPQNPFDPCAISASLPSLGTVGYIANGENTVTEGTQSAEKLYAFIEDEAFCKIMFKTDNFLIGKIL